MKKKVLDSKRVAILYCKKLYNNEFGFKDHHDIECEEYHNSSNNKDYFYITINGIGYEYER